MFCGFRLAIIRAVSRSAADPEPLSLIPGPSMTLSRWAPAMTTLSSFLPSSSAITLKSVRVSAGSTSTSAVEPGWARATPLAKLAPTTGIVWLTGVPSSRLEASATISASRSGVLPWLKMITASAPASSALRALVPKLHEPRWISAMSVVPLQLMPAKSAAWQPLVDARSPVRLMSTGMTWPWTLPEPLPVKTPVS